MGKRGQKMGAGDGAAEQARLAAERVAKLRNQLDHAERAERAWAAGAEGEAQVARIVDELQLQGWKALHDVRWPGRPKANLDHLLIGPGGVIVVDAKNWTGNVRLHNGMLRQNGYSRERDVSGVLQQCAAVAALLEPQHRRLAQGWLCMVQQPTMCGTAASGARIEGLDTLRDAVGSLPAVLDPETVDVIHDYLKQQLAGDASPALLTTGHLPITAAEHSDPTGPAAALEHWRRAQQIPVHPPTKSPTRNSPTRRRSRRNRGRPTGCLGVLLPLVLTVFFLGVFLNAVSHLQQPAPQQAPHPTPSVIKPTPSAIKPAP
jgi:Nuclease-related domain